ncbi:UNVERIFIED_CONTAM: amidohydrolase [Brevibacillus sp. OAP136]
MSLSTEQLASMAEQVKEDLVKWRRHLHQHPELSFEESETSQFVYETLLSFGGLEVTRPTRTSVMARLVGNHPGKTIALRADMDALPLTEENTFAYASQKPGVMHACGHDGHTAILLGTAKLLCAQKEQIHGEIRFLFQHAEEVPPGGAQEMVKAGVMDGVDQVIGLHLMSTLEIGKLAIGSGAMHPALGNFDITITGKGGHGAYPHETIDSVAIGAQVITNLQHIVSRNIDPLEPIALSITKIHGGVSDDKAAYNVIPASIQIGGTVRAYSSDVLAFAVSRMEQILKRITEAHGATSQMSYKQGYKPVINDEQIASSIQEALTEAFGEDAIIQAKPMMPGEDFSEFLQKAPGAYFYVGAGNEQKGIIYPHHHPRFTIDEDALSIAVNAFLHATFRLLQTT